MGAVTVSGRAAMPTPQPTPSTPQPNHPPGGQGYNDWGASIYLSNDDTMSLSSAQRITYAIDRFLPLSPHHIRPHELLNAFSFDTRAPESGDDFAVTASIDDAPEGEGEETLALSIAGRPLDKDSRRNTALTLVIDRSGSMSDEGRMSYVKKGLLQMLNQLKPGDLVNMVLFDDEVCAPVQNFVMGRDDIAILRRSIDALAPRGSTDLHLGLTRGYQLAESAFQSGYSNRVILLTDALTNTGVTNQELIAAVGKHYDERRIRLSGVGVGRNFNDTLLDRLTERGRGAYVFLGSEAEVQRIFGKRFISLIETTAVDVHFRLSLPPSLRMKQFYGEESSTVKEDVQSIHFSANTAQLFLSDLTARGDKLRPQDWLLLTIEYRDPETEAPLVEEHAFLLGSIRGPSRNVQKGRMLMKWVDGLAELSSRSPEGPRGNGPGSWIDGEAARRCEARHAELASMAAEKEVSGDAEAAKVLGLWDKYCSRYEAPRSPMTREVGGASP